MAVYWWWLIVLLNLCFSIFKMRMYCTKFFCQWYSVLTSITRTRCKCKELMFFIWVSLHVYTDAIDTLCQPIKQIFVYLSQYTSLTRFLFICLELFMHVYWISVHFSVNMDWYMHMYIGLCTKVFMYSNTVILCFGYHYTEVYDSAHANI